MKRALLIVLDSVGVGALPDADQYGDVGANTVGNIAKATRLDLPNLNAMGFSHIAGTNLRPDPEAVGAYGRMAEKSPGKDTTTGHWEMAGVPLAQAFPTFPQGFPADFISAYEQAIGTAVIGNYPASGTEILDELGEEHIKTGHPIVYTSADSVFQIAAHEDIVPLERLYEMCRIARRMLTGPLAVGRVIARPFLGDKKGAFKRTGNRRDFSLEPPTESILDALKDEGYAVKGVGKIEDIFAGKGLTDADHAAGNPACLAATLRLMKEDFNGLCFVNLVDTDMIYGHRRDVPGYAEALMATDRALPDIIATLGDEDLLIVTADHGCDPTHHGTDHTREYVPLVAWRPGMKKLHDLGTRKTFADVAATLADFFDLPQRFGARSFLGDLT